MNMPAHESEPLSQVPGINPVIRSAVSQGQTPLLPFEITVLEQKMDGHIAQQEHLGQLMAGAMSESSETWHDNSAAEAVARDSELLNKSARHARGILNHRLELAYPVDEEVVTIGSVVGVRYGADETVEHLLLTGAVRELSPEIANVIPDETEVISVSSPIGQALFDKKPGQVCSYEANGRQIALSIVETAQLGRLLA
jgi:transcription elongation GreA/GreB family factor